MGRSADQHIPADVLAAAKRAGLDTPLWYVGRSNGHEGKRLDRTLDEVVEDANREAGETAPDSVPSDRVE